MKKSLLSSLLFCSFFLLYAGTFGITGYLPSYRLESAARAVGSPVIDLSGYSADYSASRVTIQSNLEFGPASFPENYLHESVESWYGRNVDTLIYFSVKPQSDGSLDTATAEERDLNRLRNIRHLFGTELILAVSGNSVDFLPVSEDEEIRGKFLRELLDYTIENGFSGVDFDWEYPGDEKQLELFEQLIHEASVLFNPSDINISAAVSRFKPLSEVVLSGLDRINLMAYDNYGRHSTYESAVEASEYLQIKFNVAPEKINLGIPFYGRIFSGLDPQYWTRTKIYRQLAEEFDLSPSQDEAGGFYFNGIETVKKKTAYALEKGLGGIMIWELGQDSIGGNSLLKAIREEIK
ncbi:MAG: hypothetical protein JXR86_15135 [Spirochaetales bacterium]|nr:hypothetical protein [Spirochaetales bacterium]